MPTYDGEPDYQHGTPTRIGVLVTNLGTPDEPTPKAVRRYLAEFLNDPRVVEVPRLIWRMIMHGFILRFRPRRSAKAYQAVWSQAGSPLLDIAQRQSQALEHKLHQRFSDKVVVELAMRYGNPSIKSGLDKLNQRNVRQLLVLPLYPQYSAVTGASTFDAIAKVFMRKRWIPELRFINQYHDSEGYINALARSLKLFWEEHGRGEKLLLSFHGIPKKYLLKGDPYHCQCHKTARLLAKRLELKDDEWTISFQSRLGREEWLTPYTATVIAQWGQAGLGKIDTICPGFSADCVETLEEMIIEYGELYKHSGGGELRYIPCLNDNDDHIEFLADLCSEHLSTWVQQTNSETREELQLARQRAVTLGATQ